MAASEWATLIIGMPYRSIIRDGNTPSPIKAFFYVKHCMPSYFVIVSNILFCRKASNTVVILCSSKKWEIPNL